MNLRRLSPPVAPTRINIRCIAHSVRHVRVRCTLSKLEQIGRNDLWLIRVLRVRSPGKYEYRHRNYPFTGRSSSGTGLPLDTAARTSAWDISEKWTGSDGGIKMGYERDSREKQTHRFFTESNMISDHDQEYKSINAYATYIHYINRRPRVTLDLQVVLSRLGSAQLVGPARPSWDEPSRAELL